MSVKLQNPADEAESVEQEMVRLISNQSKRVPFPVFIALATIALIAAGHITPWIALVWLVLACAIMLWRFRTLWALPERADLPPVQRLQLTVRLNLLAGLVHASALLVFPLLSEAERAFFSVLLMGLCTGTVATSAGYRPALLAYLLPVMLGLALMWGLSPGATQTGWVERVIGVLLLFYMAVLLGLAREVNRGIVEAWTIRLRERDLNAKLQTALETAENASHAKTRFLAAASHDLRQPLHTITMLGAALSMRPVDARSQQIVTLLNEVAHSFSEQLDGLLDISKLDAGVIAAERKPVLIAELVTQHMAEIESLMEAKNLHPVLSCQTDDFADTDPLLFLRILRNLTQNAIKFTDSGSIHLEVRRRGARIEVVVADSGCGIAPDQQDKVFQEFYQIGNSERDRTQGLGLGLSIVQRLVALLGIGLQMQSTTLQGTRFVLSLPAVAEPTSVVARPPDAAQDANFKLCVLVIDDEKTVRTGLRILLQELGCACIEASSTEQAITQVKHSRPDLVLADYRLRGSDSGIHAIKAVHALWPGVPAVLVSGDTAPSRLQEAQYAGIRLLHKPLPLDVLKKELVAATQPDREPCSVKRNGAMAGASTPAEPL